ASLLVDDARIAQVLPCAQTKPDAACAADLVTNYGRRLFRRSLTENEKAPFLTYFASVQQRSDFRTAMKWTIVSLIESPNTLYRSELGAGADSARKLSRDELATALAYTYAGAPPSDDLLTRAEAGQLDTPEARVAEARKLLASPRGLEVIKRFLRE